MAFPGTVNGFSVDVADWFQIGGPGDDSWDTLAARTERACLAFLDLLDATDVKATFFTPGWIARRHGPLLRRIAASGHELASHGWDHARVFTMDNLAFAAALERSRKAIEDAGGARVTGYRAPGFSIDHRTPWAYMALAEQGFAYSSSVAPVAHARGGWGGAPRFAFRPLPWSELIELPASTALLGGRRLAAGGGGFCRTLPYALARWAIRQVNARDERPAVFHVHPWEIDPLQPRQPTARLPRLERLLRDFAWGRMDVLALREARRAEELAA